MTNRLRQVSAFTLIELMIVLSIIGIMATIAWSTTVGNRPKTRLTAAASEVRLSILKARTSAVRTGRNHKVCVFRDGTVTDLVAKGRMVVFSCNSQGIAGCPGTTICANAADTGGVQWSGTVDAAPCPAGTANQWCLEPSASLGINLGVTPRVTENVSISRFLTYANPPVASALNALELTYLPSGYVDTARSSALTSGSIELTNRDMCVGACGAITDFINLPRVEFVAGGGARLR